MPLFNYKTVDPEGNPIEGVLEEDTARRAVLVLEERGLQVNTVEAAGPKRRLFPSRDRLTWADLEELNEQLLTITREKLPITSAIGELTQDVRNRRVKRVLEGIRRHVEAGHSLEDAFALHPESFSPVYTTLIRAGERAGNLAGVFGCLTGYSKRMAELKNQVQEALAYPLILVTAAGALLAGMLLWVVPMFGEIFMDFGGELPAPTWFLLWVSDVVRDNAPYWGAACGVFLVACVVLISSLLRTTSSGYVLDTIKLRTPAFGRLYAACSLERFCRTLGMLIEARVPVVESLDLAAATTGNAVLRRAVTSAALQVSSGSPLAEALRASGYFENLFCWLLGNAEHRGEVDQTLQVLAEDYESSVARVQKWILLLAGPVVTVLVAFLVGYIVVSLYLPIFTLGDVVSGV